MATVRAKIKCEEEVRYASLQNRRYTFGAVYSNEPNSENAAFWTATPSLKLEMTVSNPNAWPFLEVGKKYYLDFIEVEE